jgi:hypothetical protein
MALFQVRAFVTTETLNTYNVYAESLDAAKEEVLKSIDNGDNRNLISSVACGDEPELVEFDECTCHEIPILTVPLTNIWPE